MNSIITINLVTYCVVFVANSIVHFIQSWCLTQYRIVKVL